MNNLQGSIEVIAGLFGLEVSTNSLCGDNPSSPLTDINLGIFDCTLLKGDNLPILTGLNHSLRETVDLCYIDPPYNTGKKFIYTDRFSGSLKSKPFGSHAPWMAFMLPRLVAAHALIKNTGFMAISIDDKEQPYLRILMDSIFGEDNFIGNAVVCKSKNGVSSSRNMAVNHDHLVIYSKSRLARVRGLPSLSKTHDKSDAHGAYRLNGLFRKKGDASRREDRPNLFYPLYYDDRGTISTLKKDSSFKETFPVDSQGIERRWIWGREKAEKEAYRLYASQAGVVYLKSYEEENTRSKIRSLWDDPKYLTAQATNQVKAIYCEKVFDTPKPVGLIEDVIDYLADQNALILDFFAGSATTAHAAHNLNIRDRGSRKVILVEQNADIAESHIAKGKGYNLISDITEARLVYIKDINPGYQYQSLVSP